MRRFETSVRLNPRTGKAKEERREYGTPHPHPRSIFKVASKFATHLLVTVQLGKFVDALDPIVPSPSAFPVTTSVTVPSPVVVVVAAPAVPKVAPAPTPASAPPAAPVPAPAPVPTAVPRVHPIRDRHLHRPNSLTASRPLSPKPRASLFPTQHPPPRLPRLPDLFPPFTRFPAFFSWYTQNRAPRTLVCRSRPAAARAWSVEIPSFGSRFFLPPERGKERAGEGAHTHLYTPQAQRRRSRR